MAYTPREIKDRVAVGDDIFLVEDLGNNRIRLTPTPTHVSEAGTPVNKALLQPIVDELGYLSANHVTSVAGRIGAVTLSKYDVGLGNVQNYGIATQTQAQEGIVNNVYMTPLRVKEAINKAVPTGTYIGTGTEGREINIGFQPKFVFVTPFTSASAASEGLIFIRVNGGFHIRTPVTGSQLSFHSGVRTTANGFTVGTSISEGATGNRDGVGYVWVALP